MLYFVFTKSLFFIVDVQLIRVDSQRRGRLSKLSQPKWSRTWFIMKAVIGIYKPRPSGQCVFYSSPSCSFTLLIIPCTWRSTLCDASSSLLLLLTTTTAGPAKKVVTGPSTSTLRPVDELHCWREYSFFFFFLLQENSKSSFIPRRRRRILLHIFMEKRMHPWWAHECNRIVRLPSNRRTGNGQQ